MTNLEELERLHAGLPVLRAETWNHEDGEGHAAIIAVVDPEDWCEDEHPEAYNIAVNGVRLLNALPGLIAELRAARAERRDLLAAVEKARATDRQQSFDEWVQAMHELRAALAKVPK